jgi:hypothetical protein
MGFWADLASSDNSRVNTPQVIFLALSVILVLLAIAVLIYHSFWKGKGLDAEVVKLFGILLGGGVVNAGASYFSKTTATTTVLSGAAPAPPAAAKEPRGPRPEGE